jgi:hypothetical protein
VCISHYIYCLKKELGIENSLGNPIYTPTKEEILDNHRSVLWSIDISTTHEELDLPSLYWIPKLNKCPFKQHYCRVCQTLHEVSFQIIICIPSAVKAGLQSYCDTSYSRGGVNHMWILIKTSIDLLEYIHSRSLSSCNIIKTLDFSTICTTIPHSRLKVRLRELAQLCFIENNGQHRYLVLERERSYFEK